MPAANHSKRARRELLGTPCPCCRQLYIGHAKHLTQSVRCKEFVEALEAESDDDLPELVEADSDDDIQDEFELAENAPVAEALASLKYERGFQRPDVDAAKDLARVVGKRTSELAFDSLQSLLRPGVDPGDVAAGQRPDSHSRAGGSRIPSMNTIHAQPTLARAPPIAPPPFTAETHCAAQPSKVLRRRRSRASRRRSRRRPTCTNHCRCSSRARPTWARRAIESRAST